MSSWKLDRLSRALMGGAVIGYPTDTIWGFGCHPLIAASVVRILGIKRRDPALGLILLASSVEYLEPYLDAGADARNSIATPTDPPTTWLAPASDDCPAWIRGAHSTVAVRVTRHPLIVGLCDRMKSPLTSTSANRSGSATVRNSLQMRRRFGAELDHIVSGYPTGGRRASRIRSLTDGRIARD